MRIVPAQVYDDFNVMFQTEKPPIRVFEETGGGLREVPHRSWKMTGNGFQMSVVPFGPMWAQIEP